MRKNRFTKVGFDLANGQEFKGLTIAELRRAAMN
jgi:hypothetical protein